MIQKMDSLAKLARKNSKRRILAKLRLSLLVNERAARRRTARSKFRRVRCLSPKQIQILKLLLEGTSYAEIAKELFIAENTIRSHVRCVYRILGVKGRYELIANLSGMNLIWLVRDLRLNRNNADEGPSEHKHSRSIKLYRF